MTRTEELHAGHSALMELLEPRLLLSTTYPDLQGVVEPLACSTSV